MTAVYNENDPKAAASLRHLIEEGVIAHGIVDERSIRDVEASDYRGFAQVHLFAGIGIWSSALKLAGWPDDRRVGTASCPCQGFSAAGKGRGFADPRHLWPEAYRIFRQLRIDVLFGEQAPTAVDWIDLVSSDLEGIGYAVGAPVVPAAGFGGVHIRQRFYWVADANNTQWWSDRAPRDQCDWPATGRVEGPGHAQGRGGAVRLADAHGQQWNGGGAFGAGGRTELANLGAAGRLGHGHGHGHGHGQGLAVGPFEPDERGAIRVQGPALGATGALRGCDWLLCHDAKIRPVEAGTFPLDSADSTRVGRLHAYGNALDREAAANFVAAYMDAAPARAAFA